jgi:type IV pilus assembly protein PilB
MTASSQAATTPNGRTPRELADEYGLQLIDLRRERIGRDASEAIPLHILLRTRAVPYGLVDARLKVAVADPSQIQLVDELRLVSRYPIDLAVAVSGDIDFELNRLSRGLELNERAATIGDDLPGIQDEDEETDLEAADGISDAPPIRLVNSIIVQAADDGASDLHFLPQDDALVARMRIDGILHEVERIPKRHAAGVISRIKVLAKLDIAEHRLPQDGRLTLRSKKSGRLLDVRIAVLPTVEGEGVIMRLLDKTRRAPTLTEIGLSNEMQMMLEEVIFRPTGAFLATGPTGSGKSTTLYAALTDILRPEINVITIEDPVEYRLDDVYQVQVNLRAGLTFATGLRTILRSDPDVLMVGEIRDLETAKIALEASLTGHSVFSTLHANDAPGAIARLNDIGIEPFITGSALSAVLAQRLARKLCTGCREAYEPAAGELEQLGYSAAAIDAGVTLYRRRGCVRCRKGYQGRTGIYQLLVMNDELAQLASERSAHAALEQAAVEAGMKSLWQDGLAKAAAGITTIEELTRVVGS